MARRITRRGVLKAGLIGGPVVLVSAGAGIGGWWWFSVPVDTVGQVPFQRPLAVPPLADSALDGEGRRVFELTAQAGTSELLPGARSQSWGYNGSYLGPTLRAAQGETVSINVHNQLDETTTVHWHGMHLPARFDGGPHQPIPPGGSWSPTWTIDQPAAATLWYHPHPHGRTREHVNRGLAGIFIIDGAEPDGLPHEYGVDDFPVVVQDRRFEDGQIRIGDFGETLLVNGTYGPFLEVTTELVRLRLLNGSGRRVFNFGFSDDRDFDVIGGDGSLLPAAVRRSRLQLSPAERAEILVRMRPGERVVLRSYEPDLGVNLFAGAFVGARDRFDVLELRAASGLAPSPVPPDRLAAAPDLVGAGDTDRVDRTFRMQGREINGERMEMGRIDEVVEVDTVEIWEVRNGGDQYHNFHIHDVQFQVLDVDGGPPAPELAGWKDTAFLRPGGRVRVALRFADYTDPDYPYMYHCHLLRHEDRGMMGQFVVVEPGGSAGTPPGY